MVNNFKIALFLSIIFTVSCSKITYQHDKNQGFIPTSGQISKIKTDMTKKEVIQILGNPTIINIVNPNKWCYVKVDHINNTSKNTKYVLSFKEDKLITIENNVS